MRSIDWLQVEVEVEGLEDFDQLYDVSMLVNLL